jgi:hypothetical protein
LLARTPIYAFNGGELSRRMEGRADLDGIYDHAVAQMLNFVPSVEGPAMKAPGTIYIKGAAPSAEWLARFVFNETQAYVFELGDLYVRFFTNGGRIETSPGVPLELAVPYTAAEWRRVSVWQSYDRLYLAHPNHPPAMLTRTAAETFTYEVIPLVNGPYQDWNADKAKNITWSGSGEIDGIATIQADSAIFDAGMIGSSFIFEVHSFSNVEAWEPNVKSNGLTASSTTGSLRRSEGKVYRCTDKKTAGGTAYTGTIEPTHTEGEEWDGSGLVIAGTTNDLAGCKWLYVHDRFGAGTITEVTDSDTIKIKVTRRLPIVTQTEETYKWAVGLFSDENGWPQLVTAWGQRLIFFSGVECAGSVVGDYFNHDPIDKSGTLAPDQGFRKRIETADPPIWCVPDKEYLLAGTASAELVIGQINSAAGISSDNLRADRQSKYGSSGCWPLELGPEILFVQRGGRKIRDGAFGYQQDRFVAPNLNVYARHVTRSGINWLAFQDEPETIVWGGRGDGSLIAHPHNPEQQVKGFARRELAQGTVLSGVTIPSEDGTKDELWLLAELDGQRAILKMADWWDEDAGTDQADAVFLDWCVSYDGTALDELGDPLGPKGTFTTGLSHLEGKVVRILADGAECNGLTVTAGSITLPAGKTASKVHIGLGYAASIVLLRPETRGAPTIQGLRQRLGKMIARLIDSGRLLVRNKRDEDSAFFDRSNDLPMNAPPSLFNGDTNNISVGTGSGYEVTDTIVSDDALPCIISKLTPTYEVEEYPA